MLVKTVYHKKEDEGGDSMSKERVKQCETLAEKFTQLDESGKAFIAGYIAGKQEERQKREKEVGCERAS